MMRVRPFQILKPPLSLFGFSVLEIEKYTVKIMDAVSDSLSIILFTFPLSIVCSVNQMTPNSLLLIAELCCFDHHCPPVEA